MELAYGVTSKTPDMANAKRVLAVNRGHWCIENKCHYIFDETFAEDRSRIRTGYGPKNVTQLRRFASGKKRSEKNAPANPHPTRGVRLSWDDAKLAPISIEDLEQFSSLNCYRMRSV